MIERSRSVLQRVGYAVVKMARNLIDQVGPEVFANDVAAEGKGQSGLAKPPFT
jgi:hypothetical protein